MWIAHRLLGNVRSLQGRHDEAVAVLEAGLAISGRHPWLLGTLAVVNGRRAVQNMPGACATR